MVKGKYKNISKHQGNNWWYIEQRLFWSILLVIFLVGLLLRIIGTNPGYPPTHPDEPVIYGTAIQMVLNRELDPFEIGPYKFQYPGFNVYLHAVVYLFLISFGTVNLLISDPQKFLDNANSIKNLFSVVVGDRYVNALFWGRYLTAVLGSLSLPLIFLIGRLMFNKYVGLIAALFLAVNFRHVMSSQLSIVDAPNSTFALLVLYSCLKLINQPGRKWYIISAFAVVLSLSAKLYLFSILLFLFSHLLISVKEKQILKIIKSLYRIDFIIAIAIIVIVFIATNPYLFMHLPISIRQHRINNIRYGFGLNVFVTTPLWYLWKIGIGQLPVMLAFLGVILTVFNKRFFIKSLFILLFIIPPSFVLYYYSSGGMYMRNSTSIIPFVLLFSAYGLYWIFNFLTKIEVRKQYTPLLVFLVIIAVGINYFNIKNSLIMSIANASAWNHECMIEKLQKIKFPKGTIIASPNAPLARNSEVEYKDYSNTYDLRKPFSLAELQEEGINYLELNYFSTQNYFNFWVGGNLFTDMPVEVLDNTVEGLALKELSRHEVLSCIKPWQSLDHNYTFISIPKKESVSNLKLIDKYPFDQELNKISPSCKSGRCLVIKQKSRGMFPEWVNMSKLIPVEPNKKYVVRGWLMTSKQLPSNQRDGFFRIDFYGDKNTLNKRGITAAISSRFYGKDWQEKEIQAIAPKNVKYMLLRFQSNDLMTDFFIDDVLIYEALEKPTSYELKKANGKEVDNLILYPSSI